MSKKLGDTIPATIAGKEINKYMTFTKNTLAKLPKALPGKRYYVFDKQMPKLRCYVTDRGHKSLCAVLTVEGKTTRFSVNPDGFSTVEAISMDDARAYTARLMGMNQTQLKAVREGAETRGSRAPSAKRVSRFHDINDNAIHRMSDTDKASLSAEEIMQLYLRDKQEKLSPSSIETYREVLPRHFPEEYQMPFPAILDRDLMLDAIHNSKGAMSAVRHINMLYNWAKNNILTKDYAPVFQQLNPAEQLMKTKIKDMDYQPRTNSLRKKETAKWFDVVESMADSRDTDFLLFLFLTGMRAGDTASNLRWKNINLGKGEFSMLTKGKHKEKTFPLPLYVAQRLRSRASQAAPDDMVFPQANRGQRAKLISMVAKGLGRRISNHDLRRTFSQIAAANGIEKTTIKQLMNHETDSDVTSKHYINNDTAITEWRDTDVVDPLQTASEKIVTIILKNANRIGESATVVAIRKK